MTDCRMAQEIDKMSLEHLVRPKHTKVLRKRKLKPHVDRGMSVGHRCNKINEE